MGTNGTPKQAVRSKRSLRGRRFGLRGRHLSASLFLHIAILLIVAALQTTPPEDYPIEIAVLLIEEKIGSNTVDDDSGAAAGASAAAAAAKPTAAPAAASADVPVPVAQPKAVAPRPNPKPAAPARPKAVLPNPQPAPIQATESPPDVKPTEVAPAPAATAKNAQDAKEGQSSGTGQGAAATQSTGQGSGQASGSGAGQGTGPGTGQGRNAGGGKKGGAADDYLERVRRSLERFKRYPDEARKLKQEGTVQVSFVLARDGSVLSAQVTGGSGFVLLDQAALEMFNAASPLPPVPNYVEGETVKIGMPISFSLSFFGRMF